jgi:hypothetical protein
LALRLWLGGRIVGRNRFIAPLGEAEGTAPFGEAEWRNKAIAPYGI